MQAATRLLNATIRTTRMILPCRYFLSWNPRARFTPSQPAVREVHPVPVAATVLPVPASVTRRSHKCRPRNLSVSSRPKQRSCIFSPRPLSCSVPLVRPERPRLMRDGAILDLRPRYLRHSPRTEFPRREAIVLRGREKIREGRDSPFPGRIEQLLPNCVAPIRLSRNDMTGWLVPSSGSFSTKFPGTPGIDPGSMNEPLMLLGGGVLLAADRFRRRSR